MNTNKRGVDLNLSCDKNWYFDSDKYIRIWISILSAAKQKNVQ